MELCIFEDEHYARLDPLVFARPVYDLLCGTCTLREKISRHFPSATVSLHTRSSLEAFTRYLNPDISVNELSSGECIFVNGRLLPDHDLMEFIARPHKGNIVFFCGETVVAARLHGEVLEKFEEHLKDVIVPAQFDGVEREEVSASFINYAWDLLTYNADELLKDTEFFALRHLGNDEKHVQGKLFEGVHLINKDSIFISEGAQVKPGVVIDGSKGPVIIDRDAHIFPNAVIEGPVYIGQFTLVKTGAWIYDGSTIGRNCKVGGEIEHAIIHPYSNKQHAGFLGNACLGSWVNIGADTNCSDLKNNYGFISVRVNGSTIDTKKQYLGLLMGDHSKSAINTMFNTGTVAGFSCNIFGGDFPPKYLPSFSWGGNSSLVEYDVNKSIETAKRVLLRRNKVMSETEEQLFHHIFGITQVERRKRG